MLQNRKFGRYLLYAIGEILLVVIGILIALQVDNWNETRKSEEQAADFRAQLNDYVIQHMQTGIIVVENWLGEFGDDVRNPGRPVVGHDLLRCVDHKARQFLLADGHGQEDGTHFGNDEPGLAPEKLPGLSNRLDG